MHTRETKIQGLSFIQFDIFGCYLPSRTSIEFLLNKFKDKRNKSNFSNHANETTLVLASLYHMPIQLFDKDIYKAWHKNLDWTDISYEDVNKVLTKTIASQCYLNGCSFSRVIQSIFIMNWFGDLQDNVHYSWSKSQASLNYCFNLFFDNKLVNPEYIFSFPSLVDSSEYMDARTYYLDFLSRSELIPIECLHQSFISQIGEMNPKTFWQKFIPQLEQTVSHNRQLKGCMLISLRAMKKQAEFDKHKQRLCLCEGCKQKYFTKQKGSTSNLCDSCHQKREEQRKASRKIDRKDWAHDRIGACEGRCGSPRIKINTSGSCLQCHISKQ